MQGNTAIIGTGESVLAFQAGGVDAFPVSSAEEAKTVLRKLARSYRVILVTDDLCAGLETVISRTLETPYPIVVPSPAGGGKSEYARKKMKEAMERALGVDILFEREER